MGKVAVFTVGCKVNQAESQELALDLAAAGHEVCRSPSEADICVVNTCSVTAESDSKCRKLVRRLEREGAKAIVAAGCYVEVAPADLGGMRNVVRLIPNREKDGWGEEIAAMLPVGGGGVSRPRMRARGFIKIQDGCQRGCSYCIVPRARGRERSRSPQEVKDLARRWLRHQTRELVLCGVSLGRYGAGTEYDLARMVRELLALQDGYRIRLSSIELEDLKREWLEEWAESPRICPHLHLPLQSGDGAVLADMGRGYSPETFISTAEKMRRLWPRAALTTEVIVGYPGESEGAFRNTLEVLEAAEPARIHVFRFSPRPGTRACGLARQVRGDVAEARSQALLRFAEKRKLGYAEERMGEMRDMLVETVGERNGLRVAAGTTEDYMKAIIPDPPPHAEPGRLVRARLSGWSDGRAVLAIPEKGA